MRFREGLLPAQVTQEYPEDVEFEASSGLTVDRSRSAPSLHGSQAHFTLAARKCSYSPISQWRKLGRRVR